MGIIMFIATGKVMAQQNKSTDNSATMKGMIKVTILYPGGEGKKFDMDYYLNKHIPMVKNLLTGALKLTAIDKGIAGVAPGSPAPFMVICYLYFDSISAYQEAMKLNGSKIRVDIPNYTNTQPVIQISEIME